MTHLNVPYSSINREHRRSFGVQLELVWRQFGTSLVQEMAAVAQAADGLQSEIKSVASKLGFAVPGGSFEYDDFSVDVAKQAASEPDKEGGQGTKRKVGSRKVGKSSKESGKKVKGKQKRVGVEPGPGKQSMGNEGWIGEV